MARDSSLTLDYITERAETDGLDMDPGILAQIQAAMTPEPSAPAPVRKSASEALREQQRAILDRAPRPADRPTEATSTPEPAATSEPTTFSHPIFAALLLSNLVYGKPNASYGDRGRLTVTLEGGLRLLCDLRLWTVRYQAGSQLGPLRPVRAMTLDELTALRSLVNGQASIRED